MQPKSMPRSMNNQCENRYRKYHNKIENVVTTCENMQSHCSNNGFESLQAEGVNRTRCQENIKMDVTKHTKLNGKTMQDLCSTNDAEIIGKGSKTEAEREPTNKESYAKVH